MIRVLVACEYSGTVRNAFRLRGFDAWSCDLLPPDEPSQFHIQGDVLDVLDKNWTLLIGHPPCTHLAVSGAAYMAPKRADGRQAAALEFVRRLMGAPVKHIAIENPVSVISSQIRKADQIIQPWMFGHMEQKKTCLWLKNLPRLRQTENVWEEMMKLPKNQRERLHYLPPSPDRWKLRSATYPGIAAAMAYQWGNYINQERHMAA
jgi:site-specific DNA-cytosine methylase